MAQPQDDLSKALTAAMQQKGVIGKNQVIVIDHTVDRAVGTGVGGEAIGDKATLNGEGSAPAVALPGASAMGGSSKFSGTAEMVTKSVAFRIASGIVGILALVFGINIGQQGNVRGALVIGGTGLGLLIGAILFPEWLALGLLAFFAASLVEYAWQHGAFTGAVAWTTLAVHKLESAFPGSGAAFNKEVKATAESAERGIVNKIAKANGATSVDV